MWGTSLVRNPFVSPEIISSMLLRPHTRFMQQRPQQTARNCACAGRSVTGSTLGNFRLI
ncbi:MAG: hypothetical protein VB140_06910 [Burkholderia sp.]